MRYSRLSASFIFIARDTRAQTNSEKFQGNPTRICCLWLSTRAWQQPGARGRQCLQRVALVVVVDIYWRRLAAFPHRDGFFRQPNQPPAPPTRVHPTHFTCRTSAFLLSFRYLSAGSRKDERVTSFFFLFLFNSFSRSIHYHPIRGFPSKANPVLSQETNPEENSHFSQLSFKLNSIWLFKNKKSPLQFSLLLVEKLSFSLTSLTVDYANCN